MARRSRFPNGSHKGVLFVLEQLRGKGMARSRRQRLLDRVSAGDTRNVSFTEFCRLIEAFGFTLRRVSGSHYIYIHPQVPRPLSLQPRQGEAKPYQIAQFVEIVEEFELKMEPEK